MATLVRDRFFQCYGANTINAANIANLRAEREIPAQNATLEDSYDMNKAVLDHRMIAMEYDISCQKVIFQAPNLSNEQLHDEIVVLQHQARLLQEIYKDYLSVERMAERFARDQLLYNGWLYPDNERLNPTTKSYLAKNIRANVEYYNFWRLLLVRLRRMLILSCAALNNSTYTKIITTYVNNACALLAQHQGWIFFIPRLMVNISISLQHLIVSDRWMSRQERSLNYLVRFRAHMDIERRWWELGNDIAWFLNNIVTAFVLTGALASFAIYAAVALPFYDTCFALLRTKLELDRLNVLRKQSTMTLASGDQLNIQLRLLDERKKIESRLLWQRVTVNSLLFIAMALSLPFIVTNPIIPLIGAILAVIVTIVNRHVLSKRVNPDAPGYQNKIYNDLNSILTNRQNQANGDENRNEQGDNPRVSVLNPVISINTISTNHTSQESFYSQTDSPLASAK